MSNIAIRVENLGKQYQIGRQQERYQTLRDTLSNTLKAPLRGFSSALRQTSDRADDTIWALKDVSFEVEKGSVVGIIGRNGAGKSTLLKILSRITEPTTGHIRLRGRVRSLLEVGTGFHPELTGRENIYLNGAILGMGKKEIERKFDEIVEFAEISRFIDTPVKRYSSGMYVRLAFAVAAHLESEILMVDEVLAVGDAAFQRKCLGKMSDVAQTGRTVLFVSHNMGAVQRLCSRALLISQGKLVLNAPTTQAVEAYLSSGEFVGLKTNDLTQYQRRDDHGTQIQFTKCTILNSKGVETSELTFGESFRVYLELKAQTLLNDLSLIIGFDSYAHDRITTIASEDSQNLFSISPDKNLQVYSQIDDLKLTPGTYWLTIGVRRGKVGLDHLAHIVKLEVLEITDSDQVPHSGTWGYIHTAASWEIATADQVHTPKTSQKLFAGS